MLWVETQMKPSGANQLTEDEQVYETIKGRFATHLVGRINIIFERAQFNKHVQGEQESVNDFIKSLYELAKTCQFGTLKEELIQDHIIVGIHNAMLSQKLMQDDMLTLDKAVKQAKSSELVKDHHEILKGDGEEGKINRIQDKKRQPPKDKGKLPENLKEKGKFHKASGVNVANRQHTKEKNVQLSTLLAWNVRKAVIMLQNVKAKSFLRWLRKYRMEPQTKTIISLEQSKPANPKLNSQNVPEFITRKSYDTIYNWYWWRRNSHPRALVLANQNGQTPKILTGTVWTRPV